MRLSLLRPRNQLSITPWLKRSVLSFSSNRKKWVYGPDGMEDPSAVDKSEMLGLFLLTDGKYGDDEFRVVSPVSIRLLLSLLATGSRGSTSRWILDFFNADSVDHLNHTASLLSDVILADGAPDGPRVRCSTALWLDHSLTLKPSFKRILHSHYRAAVNPLDFQTKAAQVGQQINSWAENEVSGLVKDIIREGSLNNSVKLVFTNALYFKGAWDERPGNLTVRLEPCANKYEAVAPLMMAKRKQGWKGSYIMNFDHVYKKQSEDDPDFTLHFDFEYLPPQEQPAYSTFNLSSNVEAAMVLRGLGMTSPFSGGGELTKMLTCHNHSRELYVSSIFHKAFMEVNEQGTTEAAAATAALIMSGCPPYLPPVDRLFEF